MDGTTENVTGAWVSLHEAARRRGVSPDTIRNWIKGRKIQARKVPTPQGFAYEVFLLDVDVIEIIPPSPNGGPTSEAPTSNALARSEPPAVDLTPLADLVRELGQRVAALERENGALQEQVRHLEAPTPPPRRPWWRWWAT